MPQADEDETGKTGAEGTDAVALVLAALPEDAPAGHECYEKVRWNAAASGRPYANFRIKRGSENICFQVTMVAAGSMEAALRIARICYMKFEEGMSKEKVLEFRKELYDMVKPLSTAEDKPDKPARKPTRQFSLSAISEDKTADGSTTTKEGNGTTSAPAEAVLASVKEPTKEGSLTEASIQQEQQQGTAATATADLAAGVEDAPAGSIAWSKVKLESSGNSSGYKVDCMEANSKKRVKMFISLQNVNGSHEDAARIARLLYSKIEAGTAKAEVFKLKDELLAKYRPAKKKKESTEAPKATGEPVDGGQDNGEAGEVADIGDVELDSASAQRIRFASHASAGAGFYSFSYPSPSGNIRFQVTVKAANGNAQFAAQIARLCYSKFQEGMSKDEVQKYRDELYAKVGGASAPTKRSGGTSEAGSRPGGAKRQRTNGDAALLQLLQSQSRLEGALRISGRADQKNAATVNGVYALMPDAVDGARAYEKAGGGSSRRYLFYSKRKRRWKIGDSVNDSKGFAFASVDDGGQAPPSELSGMKWSVFDGPGKGYNEDPDVQCRPFPEQRGSSSQVPSGDAASQRSDSSGDSSDDSGDDSASSSGSASASGMGAEMETEDAPAPSDPATRPNFVRSRVCAKMMVRAGLRCGCHFAHECPTRPRTRQPA
mmetsp:Transcript_8922/g.19630  ORF Transcript_8922/g.19630 Transcript_8922/m.19630 type:complete len:660 (+) Transcript_8922:166-2145(+)